MKSEVQIWVNGDYRNVKIIDLTDEQLVDEFANEIDGDTRRISSDPESITDEIRVEILRRMSARNRFRFWNWRLWGRR